MSASIGIPLSAPLISWSGLGLVALFAAVAGAVIVSAFSLALVGLDRWSAARSPAATDDPEAVRAATRTVDVTEAATPVGVQREHLAFGSLAMAIAGFAICILAVVLGLWSMVIK
jgi:hypothetical protein